MKEMFKNIRKYFLSNNPKSVSTIFIAFVAICVFVFPWLFTRNLLWAEWFHFNETGQIGDTIGGIISPFIAILAAWLTYKAFIIQYEANKQLKKEQNYQVLKTHFSKCFRCNK